MQITGLRNTYADTSINDADTAHYDLVQWKWDGMFIAVVIDGLTCELVTRSGRVLDRIILEKQCAKTVFVGELLKGTQRCKALEGNKIVAFDVASASGIDVERQPYLARMASITWDALPAEFMQAYQVEPVQTGKSAEELGDYWQLVKHANLEGLILRRNSDIFGATICRIKPLVERDYYATKINYNRQGIAMSVGGSLTKGGPQVVSARLFGRVDYADFKPGRCFVVQGAEVTEGGSIRHPKFSRWHHEK